MTIASDVSGSPGRRSPGAEGPGLRRALVMDALVAAAVAGVLMPLSLISLSAIRQPAGWMTAVVSAFVVLHASLALRRAAPVPGYLVACAAMLVVVLAPEARVEHPVDGGIDAFPMLFLPSSLTFLPVMYAVCARGGRREAVAAIAMAAVGVALASARAGDQVVAPGYPPAVQYRIYLALALMSSVSAAWGLGMSRAAQTTREAARRAEATRAAVLADRARIARDMHDVVAHSLAVIVRQAEGGALVAERAPGRAQQVLHTIAQVGREALTDMRGMLAVMRDPQPAVPLIHPVGPPDPADLADRTAPTEPADLDWRTAPTEPADLDGAAGGEPRIPAWACLADLPSLLDRVRGAGLDVDLAEHGTSHDIGPAGELAAHHVLQEALTNVVKHAGPGARVEVRLDWQPQGLLVEVRDDGAVSSRSQAHAPVPGTGSGLRGLHERVLAVGGTVSAGPEGAGFVVRARFPRRGWAPGPP